MPQVRMWEGFRDLSAKYGDMIRLRMFSQDMVVLGSPGVIFELLDRRSANSSDRKQTPSIPLMGHDTTFGLMSAGQTWKNHRRAFWQQFNPTAVTKYYAMQREMAYMLVGMMFKEPTELEKNLQDSIAAMLVRTLFGFDAQDRNDRVLKLVWDCIEGTRELLISGGFLMDFFPILRFAPSFVPFQRKLARWRTINEHFKDELFAQYKAELKTQERDAYPCMVGEVIASLTDGSGSEHMLASAEHIAKSITLDAVNAGTDTTTSILQTIFFAMSLYPSVQAKAHAELDAVVGPDRLPDFSDRESLVYLDAIIKETMRWMPSSPLGLTHCTREDDIVNGHFIPAGTVLLGNIWACLHDPAVYDDPETFRPERFLRDGRLDPDARDPGELSFGFGRRICPGRHFGLAAVYINVASALHVFDFSPPVDAHGREIRIEPRMVSGFVSRAEDARCTVKLLPERAKLIRGPRRT
ncbi:cytochrome P450 [Dichomitus squalens LYAD-421 SS1]|uniref:cytochrome P450 n=1 Tax=Dichomitus squalens (strain LYAD-421) TaxID=732165 RepID=UPI0004415B8D|nr:cytochrome P450 [Dichomitus squalens LYAD-421 SS1]EJF63284.1 cytochrome P450 [Dichomitus squalens LYAD-421 SS1]